MSTSVLPAFPDNVPTHPLLVIDYSLIAAGNTEEVDKLWKAATELGFWYLKNHGVEQEADAMFEMGDETMHLPLEEKMKFEQGDGGMSFGYKAAGSNATDEHGSKDRVEFINIAQDDALSYPSVVHRTYPSTVNDHMERTIKPFVRKSVNINNTILEVFETKLGLAMGALREKHRFDMKSGSEARCIKSPPKKTSDIVEKGKAALGAHTDFGSLSFLHNRLGGLQVLPPGVEDWQFVRPLPGHAICNVGDALTLFSGGILRSNLHRVVSPPGEQGLHTRWSVVFFTRPGDGIRLRALTEESPLIEDMVSQMTEEERQKYMPDSTAGEWFARRIRNQRVNNRTGPETWHASRGMEHKPLVV